MPVALSTPSPTRQAIASIASSWFSSRVIPYIATASTRAEKHSTNLSRVMTRTSDACAATLARIAAVPSPLVARWNRTSLAMPTAM
jgi:hypothetical protein